LFNPFTVLSCIALSTSLLHRLILTLTLTAVYRGYLITSTWFLALAIYLHLYSALLIIPIALLLHFSLSKLSKRQFSLFWIIVATVLLTLCWFTVTLFLSYFFLGDWSFLYHSYLFPFTVSDLTPNIGIWWYFFTEVFDRFRGFFLLVFLAHIIFYIFPLILRFSDEPFFLCWCVIAIIMQFQSYPVVADTAYSFILLLFNFSLLRPKIRRIYVMGFVFMGSCIVGYVMWFLWLQAGSGNANFFFFQTMIYNFSSTYTIIEAIGSVRKLHVNITPSTTSSPSLQSNNENQTEPLTNTLIPWYYSLIIVLLLLIPIGIIFGFSSIIKTTTDLISTHLEL